MARGTVATLLVALLLVSGGALAAKPEKEKTEARGQGDEQRRSDPPGRAEREVAEPTPAPDASPASDPTAAPEPAAAAPEPTVEPALPAAAANEAAVVEPPAQAGQPAFVAPSSAPAEAFVDDVVAELHGALPAQPSPPVESVGGAQVAAPGARFADTVPEESAEAPTSGLWRALWWSVPILGAAGVGGVLLLRRREAAPALPARVQAAPRTRMAPVSVDDLKGILVNGQAATQRGAYAEAVRWFDAALLARPALPVALFCKGVCLAAMGRTADAYGALQEACALAPEDGTYRIHLARVALAMGRHHEAMDALEPVAQALPDLGTAMLEDEGLRALRDHPRFLMMCGAL